MGEAVDSLAIVLETGVGIANNINNGATLEEILADAIIDIGFEVGSSSVSMIIGAGLGTLIPIPIWGTIIGAGVGCLIDFGIDIAINKEFQCLGDKSIDTLAKEDLKAVLEHSGEISAVCASIYTQSGSPMRMDRICFGDIFIINK